MQFKRDIAGIYRLICGTGNVEPSIVAVKRALSHSGPSYQTLRAWRDTKSPRFPSQHQLLHLLAMAAKKAPMDSSGMQAWRDGVLRAWWSATEAEYAAMGGLYAPPALGVDNG